MYVFCQNILHTEQSTGYIIALPVKLKQLPLKKRNRCYFERDSSESFIKDCKPENVQSVLKQEKELNA